LKILKSIEQEIPFDGAVLTVGTFDGIHMGHQKIIDSVKEQAQRLGIESVLFTFEPHPKTVIQKSGLPNIELLTTIDEKIEVLEQTGLDSLVISEFTKSFAAISAEQFVREMLVKKLKMKSIIVGHDHAFGRNREGSDELLSRLGQELDFQVQVVEQIANEKDRISSTGIRQALREGHVELAKSMLGRPYSLSGTVVHGEKQGKNLGFPTANIRPDSGYKLIPKPGIYATTVRIRDNVHESVTYIGVKPTFSGAHKVVEVHVHDFDASLYDETITVYFFRFLREDRKFNSTDELVEMIKKDKYNATTFFANGGKL
jgi:riboflavin kinase/FMN adenylyltransferase